MSDPDLGGEVRATCRRCGQPTKHRIVAALETTSTASDGVDHGTDYQIIRCCGCDCVSFREVFWHEDWEHPETGEPVYNVTLYPEQPKQPKVPESVDPYVITLPEAVRRMYSEVVLALNHDAPTLAAVGMRSLAEAICKDQGCSKRNLQDKIEELVEKGALAKRQASFLHIHRFMGNDAAHEMTAPPLDELVAGLNVLESLIQTLYQLPELVEELERNRAERAEKKE